MNKIRIKDIFYINQQNVVLSDYKFINYLDTSNITTNQITDIQKLNVKTKEIPSRARRFIKENTIIYSAVRPNLKHYGIIRKPLENMVVSTGFITLDIKDEFSYDVNYLYYNLTQNKYTNYLHTIACNNVSSYPAINPSDIENLEIEIESDVNIQKKIARLLTNIDSKIELNNKINEELEKIAKTLYDYWFVQFDFPDENNRPYKSSGGAMIYNEELKRKIPKGWEVSSLDRKKIYSSDYTANGSFAGLAEHVKYNEGIHYAILVRIIDLKNDFEDFNDLIYINRGAYDYLSKTHLKGGEVIVCNVGDVGATYRCPKLKVPMTLGPNGIVINSPIYNDYLYNYFKHGQGQLLMRSISSGSVQQKFNKTNFRNLPILMPDRNIFELFNKKYKVIRDKMENIWSENKKMRELRDFLLPMLMNGQVKVI